MNLYGGNSENTFQVLLVKAEKEITIDSNQFFRNIQVMERHWAFDENICSDDERFGLK